MEWVSTGIGAVDEFKWDKKGGDGSVSKGDERGAEGGTAGGRERGSIRHGSNLHSGCDCLARETVSLFPLIAPLILPTTQFSEDAQTPTNLFSESR